MSVVSECRQRGSTDLGGTDYLAVCWFRHDLLGRPLAYADLSHRWFDHRLCNATITMSDTLQALVCPRPGGRPSTRRGRENVVSEGATGRSAVTMSSTSVVGIWRPHCGPNRCDRSFDAPEGHGS